METPEYKWWKSGWHSPEMLTMSQHLKRSSTPEHEHEPHMVNSSCCYWSRSRSISVPTMFPTVKSLPFSYSPKFEKLSIKDISRNAEGLALEATWRELPCQSQSYVKTWRFLLFFLLFFIENGFFHKYILIRVSSPPSPPRPPPNPRIASCPTSFLSLIRKDWAAKAVLNNEKPLQFCSPLKAWMIITS